jgi:GNAT superfamily N-acetyltransferase
MKIQRLAGVSAIQIDQLAEVLHDCVHGGASVSFMLPFPIDEARRFWQGVAQGVERRERMLIVGETEGGRIVGTVQLVLAQPPNQPHRADLAKMLVHRMARGRGLGALLLQAAERAALDCGKTLLVLDTASAEAERCTNAPAGFVAAECPTTRCCHKVGCAIPIFSSASWRPWPWVEATAAFERRPASSGLERCHRGVMGAASSGQPVAAGHPPNGRHCELFWPFWPRAAGFASHRHVWCIWTGFERNAVFQ